MSLARDKMLGEKGFEEAKAGAIRALAHELRSKTSGLYEIVRRHKLDPALEESIAGVISALVKLAGIQGATSVKELEELEG